MENSWRSASPLTKGTFLLVAATAFATVAYSVIAGFQLSEMKRTNDLTKGALGKSDETLNKTLEKMQAQIDEAKRANNYTFDIIRGTQEAVVTYGIPFVISDQSTFDNAIAINIGNAGKVAAKNVAMHATLVRKSLPAYRSFGRAVSVTQFMPLLAPAGQPGSGMELTFDGNPYRGDREAILNRFETLEIRGTLTYENGFGEKISSDFCQAYLDVTSSKGFFPCYDFMRLYQTFIHHENEKRTKGVDSP